MSQEASFTFTTPLNVNVVNLKGEEHLFVEGDISTTDIDLVNDIMTKECQESIQRQMLERTFKLDLEHEAFRGESHEEKEIAKTKIPAGKIIDSTVRDLGENRYSTSVKGEINRHHPNYKSIKGNLTEGYLDAFSVAFLATDVTYDVKDGERVRMLNDVKLLNVALTGNPCNTKAQLSDIFMKSMDAVEEYKRMKAEDPDIEGQLVVKNNIEELKFKYAKRTGSPGNYTYWYKNPKTGRLEAGDKPKKQTPSKEDWKKEDKEKYDSSKRAIEIINESGSERIKEIDAEISLKEKYIKEIGNPKTPRERDRKELLEGDIKNLERRKKDLIETFDRGIKREESEMRRIEDKYKNKKSNSIPNGNDANLVGNQQLNNKQKKMTEKNLEEAPKAEAPVKTEDKPEGTESENVEEKALFNMNAELINLKSENVTLKDAVTKITDSLAKITKALEAPIHKSEGVQINDAEVKANASETKSVDPLSLFR